MSPTRTRPRLAMLGLVAAGTLGYLPVNLRTWRAPSTAGADGDGARAGGPGPGAGPGRRPPLPAPMERAARRGRQARLRAAHSARCHLLSPRCRASPLEAVRRGTGVRLIKPLGTIM
ncbi:hypothetical protein FJT64_002193 [Amphibalanus amphitrite]|uniref:Uncharacterized protein n=1 Tax=Amphibalanus amphitrite TaxID=1232801 RepID=A0A6A4WMM4_AMPAM|nr:hypothetical protein FJT64_002193 [Amphibalanus amphitrite]